MKSFLPCVITAVLLAACSPTQYKVNPPAREEVSESQEQGYMRILGDLRWDQLTSTEEWKKRFPECLNNSWYSESDKRIIIEPYLDNNFVNMRNKDTSFDKYVEVRKCSNFAPGGIPVNISRVEFAPNSGVKSKSMTRRIRFDFFDDSQSRGLKSALAKKYKYNARHDAFCSKYTCWSLTGIDKPGSINARPTPYTISILDQVRINTSDL